MQDWKTSDAVKVILKFVDWCRKRWDIKPTLGVKPEGSCFHNGEFVNLLYVQLVRTREFDGCWGELQIPENVVGVLAEIQRNRFYQSEAGNL